MEFIKLPTKIALAEDVDRDDNMGIPTDWQDGFVLCNIGEIQEVVEGVDVKDECSIFYKSGDSTKICLNIDDLATIIESK